MGDGRGLTWSGPLLIGLSPDVAKVNRVLFCLCQERSDQRADFSAA